MSTKQGLEFSNLEELEQFLKSKSLFLRKKIEHSIIGDIVDEKEILWGYVSNNPSNYKCKKTNTKYILIWE